MVALPYGSTEVHRTEQTAGRGGEGAGERTKSISAQLAHGDFLRVHIVQGYFDLVVGQYFGCAQGALAQQANPFKINGLARAVDRAVQEEMGFLGWTWAVFPGRAIDVHAVVEVQAVLSQAKPGCKIFTLSGEIHQSVFVRFTGFEARFAAFAAASVFDGFQFHAHSFERFARFAVGYEEAGTAVGGGAEEIRYVGHREKGDGDILVFYARRIRFGQHHQCVMPQGKVIYSDFGAVLL